MERIGSSSNLVRGTKTDVKKEKTEGTKQQSEAKAWIASRTRKLQKLSPRSWAHEGRRRFQLSYPRLDCIGRPSTLPRSYKYILKRYFGEGDTTLGLHNTFGGKNTLAARGRFNHEFFLFHMDIFNLRPFDQFTNQHDVDEAELFDIVGQVVTYETVQTYKQGDNKSVFMNIELEDDKRNKISATLWSELVDQIQPHLNVITQCVAVGMLQKYN
nr:uncharacterized protein LOC104109284 isoform X2 [Nicotiana tomentosiformis]XP_033515349.1 uncharacterized protein LOC104109285 isoform X2 [Nicotiana tomentosiformis]XP_033515350.1 uncharacterized protein LOC104109286 isoform X2 [Nicotiana tomentosiformis]